MEFEEATEIENEEPEIRRPTLHRQTSEESDAELLEPVGGEKNANQSKQIPKSPSNLSNLHPNRLFPTFNFWGFISPWQRLSQQSRDCDGELRCRDTSMILLEFGTE